ncbi:MAG TPA: Gfo/Idh/MocA family oxidoreductase [Planctomycetota bacterium]|nr:Gfo/Idh/MocA family oxidoreductase [Planctomycetota bacterium]
MARPKINRREFLGTAGAAGAGFWIAGRQTGFGQEKSPNAKLNVACIGVGGRGRASLDACRNENVVAICDIDEGPLSKAAKDYPGAKVYTDYRKLLDEMANQIDAVTVGTPDHHHAPAAARAIALGKHAYVEKPLTHNIYEARKLTELAAKHKVATQMGNQGHSTDSRRRLVEALQQGIIGKVTEVHAWTNRPIWPQAMKRPTKTDPVPPGLHWDLFLGPAPERPFVNRIYHPFAWRGWWDFGTVALGDMACHIMDAAFWGLNLRYPTRVEAEGDPLLPETGPKWMTVKLDFPARGEQPPLKFIWYDGKKSDSEGRETPNLPPAELAKGVKITNNGNIIVGDKGTIVVLDEQTGNWKAVIDGKVLDKKELDIKQTLPRVPGDMGGHHGEWIAACKGGPKSLGDFSYSGPFTETVLIGIVAFRTGKALDWDGEAMKAKNCPEAEPYIRREYRKGWEV